MALLKAAKLARQQASKSQPQSQTQSITSKEQQAPTEVDSELGNTGSKGGQHLKVMPSLGRSPKGKKDKGKKKVQSQKPQAQKAQTQKAQARKEQRQARRKHKQAVRKANNQSNG